MFSYIKGTLEEVTEGQIVVDCHGIGYQIQTSNDILDVLPSIGADLKIYTYLHVKDDGIALFGFPTKEDLTIFCLLLRVNGIGPKGALGILSALSADELRFAVLAGDAMAIAKAPGIGAKSAQRIILELKDKLNLSDVLQERKADTLQQPSSHADTARNEAVSALTALGYSSSEALSAVTKADFADGADVEEILKAALKQMAMI